LVERAGSEGVGHGDPRQGPHTMACDARV
jgi:hypothetical protein